MRLGEDVRHVYAIKMADVRTHEGMQLGVERIRLGAEGPRVDRVVGLTAEVEVRHKQVADVRSVCNLATREIIHRLDAGQQLVNRGQLVAVLRKRLRAIALEIFCHHLHIEVHWTCIFKRLQVALLPMANEIAVQRARPADASFQKSEVERGKTTSDTIQEQGFANRFASSSEVSNVIVDKVRNGRTRAHTLRRSMKRWGHFEFDTLRPDRIVVVLAV